MFRKILSLVFAGCIVFALEISAQNTNRTARQIAGTYFAGNGFVSRSISLDADSTYMAVSTTDDCLILSEEARECVNYPVETGTFSIAGNTLKLNPQTFKLYRNGEWIHTPPPAYEYSIIKWSERFYLVEKDELKRFADAVNLKFEPRKNESARRRNYFLLRREGSEKPVAGLPDLPNGWNDFLLKKPVEAVVLGVFVRNGERVAVIDKGSRDGLKVGVQIVTSYSPEGSEVISVKKTTAEVRLKYDLEKGAKVRTFFDPGEWILDADTKE